MTEVVMDATQVAIRDRRALKNASWRLIEAVFSATALIVVIVWNQNAVLDFWLAITFLAVFGMLKGSWDNFKKWKQPRT